MAIRVIELADGTKLPTLVVPWRTVTPPARRINKPMKMTEIEGCSLDKPLNLEDNQSLES